MHRRSRETKSARRPKPSGILPSTSSALPACRPPPNPRRKLGIHHLSPSTATAAGGSPAYFGREMAGGTCSVCNEAPSKYKCPSCRTPYCSVTCFKNHKAHSSALQEGGADCLNEKDQQPSSVPDTICPAKSLNTLCPTKALEVEDPSWLVDNNRLRSIAELKEIRDAVRDPDLQKMILKIDGSSEPEKELEKLTEGQAFRQFTDKILDIVSPEE